MVGHRNTTMTPRVVLAACEAMGVDGDAILAVAGLTRAQLEDPEAFVDMERMQAFWQGAYRLSKDPHLALNVVENVPIGTLRMGDYLLASAATFGSGLDRLARYFSIINTWLSLEITAGDDEVSVCMHTVLPVMPPPSQEFVFGFFVHRARGFVGPSFDPARIEFDCAFEGDGEVHRRFFRSPVLYEQPAAVAVFRRVDWDRPSGSADPALSAVLESHAKLLEAAVPIPDDMPGLTRHAIAARLADGDASKDAVAKDLGMSARTLQRRLAGCDRTFAQLVDEVRLARGRAYLKDATLSLAEIAFLLGFSDQTAFTRSFKRWTGQTPGAFRAALP